MSRYLGLVPNGYAQIQKLDSLTSQFNGVLTAFQLKVAGVNASLTRPEQLVIVLGGVIQEPNSSFTLGGVGLSTITFTEAPPIGVDFWGLILVGYDNLNINEVDILNVSVDAKVPNVLAGDIGLDAANTNWVQNLYSIPFFRKKSGVLTTTLTHNATTLIDISGGTLIQSPTSLGLTFGTGSNITIPSGLYGLWDFRVKLTIEPPASESRIILEIRSEYYDDNTTSWVEAETKNISVLNATGASQTFSVENLFSQLITSTAKVVRFVIFQTNSTTSALTLKNFQISGRRLSNGIY